MGPVETEINRRLTAALTPEALLVTNDSASHHGHSGDDGSGESHFTVDVTSAAFTGKNRVARQRLINHALGDLMRESIHALAIKARAPGE
jgi:BolA family transcriptional regulator, general stress-responsive regulator